MSDASAYGSDEVRRLGPIIDLVELPDQAKQFLRSHWLSQIDFIEVPWAKDVEGALARAAA